MIDNNDDDSIMTPLIAVANEMVKLGEHYNDDYNDTSSDSSDSCGNVTSSDSSSGSPPRKRKH